MAIHHKVKDVNIVDAGIGFRADRQAMAIVESGYGQRSSASMACRRRP